MTMGFHGPDFVSSFLLGNFFSIGYAFQCHMHLLTIVFPTELKEIICFQPCQTF